MIRLALVSLLILVSAADGQTGSAASTYRAWLRQNLKPSASTQGLTSGSHEAEMWRRKHRVERICQRYMDRFWSQHYALGRETLMLPPEEAHRVEPGEAQRHYLQGPPSLSLCSPRFLFDDQLKDMTAAAAGRATEGSQEAPAGMAALRTATSDGSKKIPNDKDKVSKAKMKLSGQTRQNSIKRAAKPKKPDVPLHARAVRAVFVVHPFTRVVMLYQRLLADNLGLGDTLRKFLPKDKEPTSFKDFAELMFGPSSPSADVALNSKVEALRVQLMAPYFQDCNVCHASLIPEIIVKMENADELEDFLEDFDLEDVATTDDGWLAAVPEEDEVRSLMSTLNPDTVEAMADVYQVDMEMYGYEAFSLH